MKNPIYKLWRGVRRLYLDIESVFISRHENRIKRKSDKIRVGFICQYLPSWNKLKPVYDELIGDERFETVLICVPSGIENSELTYPDSLENDTYDYYIQNGYGDRAVNALIGADEWLDLKSLDLDFVFYSRPYNHFMPKPYHSRRVSKYSKICCVMYGMEMLKQIAEVTMNRDFFRNLYCFFAEDAEMKASCERKFRLRHKLGVQKTVYSGCPALKDIFDGKDGRNALWEQYPASLKIIWTPRWTTDLRLGGSNFFTYKDYFFKYAKENPEASFLFRPHPLAFDNFIKSGEMTAEEVGQFMADCQNAPNILLDTDKQYTHSFWSSDVLVSDYSGVVPEYFITGKPLIFCKSNMVLDLTETAEKMLEGCYVVYNEQQMQERLDALKRGDDPLKEKRGRIIKELFGNTLTSAARNVVEELSKARSK